MKRLSIRWRLTLWYAAALGLILTLFCVILLLLTRQQLLKRTDAALREELRELALDVRLANPGRNFDEQLRTRFFQHDIYDFLVSDEQRNVLFASSGLTPGQAASLAFSAMETTRDYSTKNLDEHPPFRSVQTVVESPRGRVVVQSMTPMTPFYEEMQTLGLLMVILVPLGLLFAVCGGYFLATKALAPVEQIVRVASDITISNLDRRIEVLNPHDELGHLSTTLNFLIARLERAVAEIKRFTADASHELRTPLAVLRSEAECALRMPRTAEEYVRTLSVVVEEATRLGRLADQLLNLSRDEAGITNCRRESVRIDAILLDVLEQLQQMALVRDVTLECSLIEACETDGDDIRLSQAFFNIVDNAIKYTPAQGIVRVSCRMASDGIVIIVRDTGIGIPREHLGRVFDRFFRVDSSRHTATGGTGLGLAICRAAILAHHGEVAIESEPGKGTTVTIHLPGTAVSAVINPLSMPDVIPLRPSASIPVQK